MRTALLLGSLVATGVIVWLLAARNLANLVDRFYTLRLRSTPVHTLRYDNGTIEVGGVRLDTLTTRTLPSGLTAQLAAGRVALAHHGATFPCGPGAFAPGSLSDFTFSPDRGDTVTFSAEQSHLSWPTPFAMNFVTGSAPSRKRHLYCRLTWTKRSRARLEILWRFEQGFFQPDGWRPAKIDYGSAGLLFADIAAASDLDQAAVAYLDRTHHWNRADYRLESRGPAVDGSGELIAALHNDDAAGLRPGGGRSVQLLLGYETRQVIRELAFQ